MYNKMNLPFGWVEELPQYWAYQKSQAWIGEPIESNKFLLVSWRMTGSEFCKELIRENYPETANINHWAKSHIIIGKKVTQQLIENADTKVFVIISDPRDAASNLIKYDNGLHLHNHDYPSGVYNLNSTQFLNEVADKQIELINHYTKTFGDNCIVLRYEDAFQNQDKFHNQVSKFIGYEPLGIDDVRKYKWSIYKNVGMFRYHFDDDVLLQHYNEYKWFYDKWQYPIDGMYDLKYGWHKFNDGVDKRQLTEDYKKMLKRNGVSESDRTKNIDEF